MRIEVRTLTALDRRELDRLVQRALAQGWQPVGTPAEMTHNGLMGKARWQQPMWRK